MYLVSLASLFCSIATLTFSIYVKDYTDKAPLVIQENAVVILAISFLLFIIFYLVDERNKDVKKLCQSV